MGCFNTTSCGSLNTILFFFKVHEKFACAPSFTSIEGLRISREELERTYHDLPNNCQDTLGFLMNSKFMPFSFNLRLNPIPLGTIEKIHGLSSSHEAYATFSIEHYYLFQNGKGPLSHVNAPITSKDKIWSPSSLY